MDEQTAAFFQNAPQDAQQNAISGMLSSLSDEQKQQLANLLNQHPTTNVDPNDQQAMTAAFQQHAQTAASGGESPLQELFSPGGLLGSPLAKVAVTAIAGAVGAHFLRQ